MPIWMKSSLEQVAAEAMSMSLADRSTLTRILLETLGPESESNAAEIEQAWDAEIEKRVDEILSGKVKTIPADEVFARIRAKFG